MAGMNNLLALCLIALLSTSGMVSGFISGGGQGGYGIIFLIIILIIFMQGSHYGK